MTGVYKHAELVRQADRTVHPVITVDGGQALNWQVHKWRLLWTDAGKTPDDRPTDEWTDGH